MKNTDLPYVKGKKYSMDNLVKLDWENRKDSLYLTKLLNQQCIITQIQYDEINKFCNYTDRFDGNIIKSLKIGEEFRGYPIEDSKKFCYRMLINSSSYNDVFVRDQKALKDRYEYGTHKINVELNAVVIIKNGIYMGHVYCWLSPNKDCMFMMGVRSNILMPLFKDGLKGVSSYILEAVRKFALKLGAKYLAVPYPIGGMQTKLSELGFKENTIEENVIGYSGLLSSGQCDKCYIKYDLNNPLGYDIDISVIP